MEVHHQRLHADEWLGLDVNEILAGPRVEDLYEFGSVGATPQDVAAIVPVLVHRGDAWIHYAAHTEGLQPVFMWGVYPTIPGVYQLWGFGTNLTRRALPQITRWGLGEWLPNFPKRFPGARRIEVRVPVSSVHSINWLRKLGMEIEARLPRYGVWDEDFFQLAMTFHKEVSEYVPSAMATQQQHGQSDSQRPGERQH